MTSSPKKPEQSSPTPARALAEAPVPQDGLGLWLYSALDSQRLEAREERRDMEGRLNERFSELGGKVSSVDRRLSAVERQGAAVEGRLSAVETGLAELGKRLDNQGVELRGRSDNQFAELRGYIDSQVSELRGHIDSQVSELRGHIDSQVSELRSYVDSQIAELRAETREGFKAVNATLSQICARLDRMEAASAAREEQREQRRRLRAWLGSALIGLLGAGLVVLGQFLLQ